MALCWFIAMFSSMHMQADLPDDQHVKIPTDRGVQLEARLARPKDAKAPLPAVVIAPGQGYDMDAPLIKGSFDELAKRGFLVVRFNWDFYTRKSSPSRGLGDEIADLKAALAFARSQDGVDPERVFLVGKSLGSLAAIQVALADDSIAGVALLTVAMHPPGRPQRVNPFAAKIRNLQQPVLIISGDADPLCNLAALKKLLDQASPKPQLVVVPGDHVLRAGDSRATKASEEKAISELATWLSRLAEQQAS